MATDAMKTEMALSTRSIIYAVHLHSPIKKAARKRQEEKNRASLPLKTLPPTIPLFP
jgi:hypothetical protein